MTRSILRGITTALFAGVLLAPALPAYAAEALPSMEVFKSPYCGCCSKWVEHMQQAGFKVKVTEVDNTEATRQRLGMPQQYASCHTASVGNYTLEGHVPAADVKKLLKDKPAARGLAVPGMPAGSPGMETDKPQAYDTLLIGRDGKSSVFARH